MEGSCEECGGGKEVWGEGVGGCAEGEKVGVVRACGEKGETEILGKTQHVVVPGRRPPGRPKETWRRNMQEELASLNLQEEQAESRDQWKCVINHLSS